MDDLLWTNVKGVGNAACSFVPDLGQTVFVFDGSAAVGGDEASYFLTGPISLPL